MVLNSILHHLHTTSPPVPVPTPLEPVQNAEMLIASSPSCPVSSVPFTSITAAFEALAEQHAPQLASPLVASPPPGAPSTSPTLRTYSRRPRSGIASAPENVAVSLLPEPAPAVHEAVAKKRRGKAKRAKDMLHVRRSARLALAEPHAKESMADKASRAKAKRLTMQFAPLVSLMTTLSLARHWRMLLWPRSVAPLLTRSTSSPSLLVVLPSDPMFSIFLVPLVAAMCPFDPSLSGR